MNYNTFQKHRLTIYTHLRLLTEPTVCTKGYGKGESYQKNQKMYPFDLRPSGLEALSLGSKGPEFNPRGCERPLMVEIANLS